MVSADDNQSAMDPTHAGDVTTMLKELNMDEEEEKNGNQK